MHAIAMVHKMQRLALSSSSMIPATPISEEPKELVVQNDDSATNHKEQMDGIDPTTTLDPVPSTDDVQPSIVDGTSSDPMDL